MLGERAVLLNGLAQGIRPLDQGVRWFQELDGAEQVLVLRELAEYCYQARALAEDAPESVRRAGLRPTHTPAVLLARGRHLGTQLTRIVQLPPDERVKSFRLLVALLAVADDRRRVRFCADGCTHAWHHLESPAGAAPGV
ncbi:DUF5958 family protein [Kitasatospora sp. NPDC088134]|uniref:DUF5958 family protein n=1 Tax=Kitasatospora sp. NPDC088134 TaxID=3364071 RepID=UPI00380F38FF